MLDKLIFDRSSMVHKLIAVVLAVVLVVGLSSLPPYAKGSSDDATIQTAEVSTKAEADAGAQDDDQAVQAASVQDKAEQDKADPKKSEGAEEDEASTVSEDADDEDASQDEAAASDDAEDPEEDVSVEADDDAADDENASDQDEPAADDSGDPADAEEVAILSTAAVDDEAEDDADDPEAEGEEEAEVADAVAMVGDEGFETLADAFAAAAAGDTVKLLSDVEFDETIAVSKSVTLSLNGKTASYTGEAYAFDVSGKLAVKGSASGSGIELSKEADGIFNVRSGADLSITGASLLGSTKAWDVNPASNSFQSHGLIYLDNASGSGRSVTLSGVTASTNHCIVASSLDEAAIPNSTVKVSGGSFSRTSSTDEALFSLVGCASVFDGVSISGGSATCVAVYDDVEATFADNNFTTTGDYSAIEAFSGAKVSISSGSYSGSPSVLSGGGAVVSISGGTFTGGLRSDANDPGSIVVTGGTFNAADDSIAQFLAPGYAYDATSGVVSEAQETAISLEVSEVSDTLVFTGQPQAPGFTVKTSEGQPLSASDFTASYQAKDADGNNALVDEETGLPVNAGAYVLTVSGTGDLAGAESGTAEFSIAPTDADLSIAEIAAQVYVEGASAQPPVTVTCALEGETYTLDPGTDYTVEYGDNDQMGEDAGSVTVTGAGNYAGTGTATFDIVSQEEIDAVAMVGSAAFMSLAEAVSAAVDGDTVTLLKSTTLGEKLSIDKKLAIDLNGFTVSTDVACAITAVSGGDVSIVGGVLSASGDDVLTADGGAITLGQGLSVDAGSSALWATNGGTITVAGATVSSASSKYTAAFAEGAGSRIDVTSGSLSSTDKVTLSLKQGAASKISGGLVSASNQTTVNVGDGATFEVTGGEVSNSSSTWVTVYVIGAGAQCNLKGGTVSSQNTTALSPCNGTTTISGDALVSSQGVYTVGTYANNAVLNIQGGTIENTGGQGAHYAVFATNTAAVNMSGGTLQTEGAYGIILNGDGVCNISGGNVLAAKALAKTSDATFAVSGGAFSTVVPFGYCAEGYIPVYEQNAEGLYEVEAGEAVAQVGDKVYTSVNEAFAEAADRSTVKLLADVTEAVNVDRADCSLSFDLNGKALTAADSADPAATNEKAYALRVLAGEVTLANGKVVADEDSDYAVWASGAASVVNLEDGITVTAAHHALAVDFGAAAIVYEGATLAGGDAEHAVATVEGTDSLLDIAGAVITGAETATAVNATDNAIATIESGTITGAENLLVADDTGVIEVWDGWYSSPVPAEYCVSGLAPCDVPNDEGLYTVIADLTALKNAELAVAALQDALKSGADGADWDLVIAAAYRYGLASQAVAGVADGVQKTSYQSRLDALTEAIQGITELDLSGKDIAENQVYDGTDAGSLAYYTGLTTLDLSDTGITSLGGIAGLSNLKALDLSGDTDLSEMGAIARLSSLEDLSLADTGADNGVYGPLVALSHLKRLDLSGNADITAIGPLTTNGAGADTCAQSIEILNVSNTGITQMQEVWNATAGAASLPALKSLTADGLELSSISGLAEIVNAAGFDASGILWRLGGSALMSDPDNHVGMIKDAFAGTTGTFIPPVTAIAQIQGGSYYGSLADAVAAASDGDTVILLSGVTEDVEVAKSLTIDLGGNTLTAAGTSDFSRANSDAVALHVTGQDVLVKNGNVTGTVPADGSYSTVIWASNYGTNLTLGEGLNVAAVQGALYVEDGAAAVVDGAALNSTSTSYTAAAAVGSRSSITVKSGSLTAPNSVICATMGATLNIQGGTIEDTGALAAVFAYDANTTINVTGGTIKAASGQAIRPTTGSELYMEDGHLIGVGANNPINVGPNSVASIYGGTIEGQLGIVAVDGGRLSVCQDVIVSVPQGVEPVYAERGGTAEVWGGWFSTPVNAEYCLEGYAPMDEPNLDPSGVNTVEDEPEGYYTVATVYTVVFANDDGTVLQSSQVIYGDYPEYTGETPAKDADAQYTYTFAGWDKDIAAVEGDATYTAAYDRVVNEYAVTFVDEDGAELQSGKVAYGETPAYSGEEPQKGESAAASYYFNGWDKTLAPVTEDITYTATYGETPRTYTVDWKDENGILKSDENVSYGAIPEYDGPTPTKEATAQYSFTFTGWGEIHPVTGDVAYIAQFAETVNEYTVQFVNDDGAVLQSDTLAYGATPAYAGATPTKDADAQYTYTFAGWDSEIAPITGETTYRAQYAAALNSYTVQFVNDDGTVLQSEDVDYGQTPVYNRANPVKAADAQYAYTFAGWDADIAPVTGEATYTATYERALNEYTVTFLDEDGQTVLQSWQVAYGTTPQYSGTPTKAATAQYSYSFSGWTPSVASVTGDASYRATFTPSVNEYTITFLDEDGAELQSGKVAYGQVPAYEGDTPTKASTAELSYAFAGWDEEPAFVTGDATYTATYAATTNTYTVIWNDDDGTELASSQVAYGATPGYSGAVPTKASDATHAYAFAGWTPAVSRVQASQVYTATYDYVVVNDTTPAISLAAGSARTLNVDSSSAVTWTTGNASVATVNAAGRVTAVAEGSATITATTAEGLSVSYTVTVTAASNNDTDNGSSSSSNDQGNGSSSSSSSGSSSSSNAGSSSSTANGSSSSASAGNGSGSSSSSSASGTTTRSSSSSASSATSSSIRSSASSSSSSTRNTASGTGTATNRTTNGTTSGTATGNATAGAAAAGANTGAANTGLAIDPNTGLAADTADAAAEAIEDDANALAAAPSSSVVPETIEDDANALSGGDWDADGDAGVADNGSWWLWALAIVAVLGAGFIWFLLAKRRKDDDEEEEAATA